MDVYELEDSLVIDSKFQTSHGSAVRPISKNKNNMHVTHKNEYTQYTHMHTYTHAHSHIHTCILIHVHAHTLTYTFTCAQAYMHTPTHTESKNNLTTILKSKQASSGQCIV